VTLAISALLIHYLFPAQKESLRQPWTV